MKNVLLLGHGDFGEKARLQAALDLMGALGGHLSRLDIGHAAVLTGSDYIVADAELTPLAEARRGMAATRYRSRPRLALRAISRNRVDGAGNVARLLRREAGPTDMHVLASDLAMRAGRPILAVPANSRGFEANGQVLVAWDGSLPVIETVRAITPLLALAQTVTLLEIGRVEGARATDAAAYLSLHGISARVDRARAMDRDVGEVLASTIEIRRPAFCVMGAYGHSRVRETLFGGVTRRMLGESPVPLLISH